MLLINDGKSELLELNRVFNDGMSTDNDVNAAVEQSVQHFIPLFSFDNACEQPHLYIHAFEKVHDGLKVLFCQYFRGSHQGSLIAVVYGYQHRHDRDKRLSRPHITL